MKPLHFTITIGANGNTVWDTMLTPDTYRVWTSVLMEGSYFEGSWEKGKRIRFLTPDGNGMTAVIAENRPYEFLSIKHLGYVKDGEEDTDSEMVQSWAPSFENYSFKEMGSFTGLEVSVEVPPEFEAYMADVWPKALEKLKIICEAAAGDSKGIIP